MSALVAKAVPIDPRHDPDRLAAVDRYDILDTRREESFDRITRLIKLTLGVEIAHVSLMDAHRQWFKSMDGFDVEEVPLDVTFCRYVLADGKPMVVPDTRLDSRLADNPFVTGPAQIRSYAGAPLLTPDGYTIGTVCAVGSTARDFSPREQSILKEFAALAMDQIALRQVAMQDSLTTVATRRAFREESKRFVALAKRHRSALSAISFDLDHFKSVNDTYGHAGGDQVLVAVAKATQANLRKSDLFGRLGGEEFGILLPQTSHAHAMEVADKLRMLFRSLKFPGSKPPLSITASFGVATFDPAVDDFDSLMQKADEALYEAKRTGRNRCAGWRPSGTPVVNERRRVLKAGKIVFNTRRSVMDCTVRALGEDSAELYVSSSEGVPDTFALRLVSEGQEWGCHVVSRAEQRLIVQFD